MAGVINLFCSARSNLVYKVPFLDRFKETQEFQLREPLFRERLRFWGHPAGSQARPGGLPRPAQRSPAAQTSNSPREFRPACRVSAMADLPFAWYRDTETKPPSCEDHDPRTMFIYPWGHFLTRRILGATGEVPRRRLCSCFKSF